MYTIHLRGETFTSDDPKDVLRTVLRVWRQDIFGLDVWDRNRRVLIVEPDGGVSFPLIAHGSAWTQVPSAINPGAFFAALLAPVLD